MTWSDTPVAGQQSVSANKAPINNAFIYIANEMKKDHFWDNANNNLDGRHQFVQMPKFEAGGNPANPAIATDMNGVFYMKDKTAGDAPDLQMTEPFYQANDGTRNQIEQVGFRAMIHFEMLISNPFTITEKYVHNCSVVRTAVGQFTLTFDVQMPTANYILFGTALRTGTDTTLNLAPRSGTKAARITATTLQFTTESVNNGVLRDPLVVMLAVCGG